MKPTRLVASTRHSEREFWTRTLLGRSLSLFPEALRPELSIRFGNTGQWGLPDVYNGAGEACPPERNLLFVHDDVFLHDLFLQHHLHQGLQGADLIGLAGSRGSDLDQPSWGLGFDDDLKPTGWQKGSRLVLSGAVSHVSRYLEPGLPSSLAPAPQLGVYGAFPAECDLLDGLFLACDSSLFRRSAVRFDERFRFHLYDLDFCRTARRHGWRLSTWPVLVSHGSGGNFDTDEFRAAARLYLQKWKEADSKQQTASGSGSGSLQAVCCQPSAVGSPQPPRQRTTPSTGTLEAERAP